MKHRLRTAFTSDQPMTEHREMGGKRQGLTPTPRTPMAEHGEWGGKRQGLTPSAHSSSPFGFPWLLAIYRFGKGTCD